MKVIKGKINNQAKAQFAAIVNSMTSENARRLADESRIPQTVYSVSGEVKSICCVFTDKIPTGAVMLVTHLPKSYLA